MKKPALWLTICLSCVAGFEGLRTVAYLDPVGIPTICFGETRGVVLGQSATPRECQAMLAGGLRAAENAVAGCTTVPMPDTRRAAMVSFTYNVGEKAYCSSTLLRKLNAGDTLGACNELLRWTKARGIDFPGLRKRREQERLLCLQGVI